MWGKFVLLAAAGAMLAGCDRPAEYWARVCEAHREAKEFVAAGKARVVRAMVLHLGDTAAMWPDFERYPRCVVPVRLEFSDDVDLDEFLRLRSSEERSFYPLIVSGRGEWIQIPWGDVGDFKTFGFAIASPKVHGRADISDEEIKARMAEP